MHGPLPCAAGAKPIRACPGSSLTATGGRRLVAGGSLVAGDDAEAGDEELYIVDSCVTVAAAEPCARGGEWGYGY